MIETELKSEFSGRDFVHGFKYETLEEYSDTYFLAIDEYLSKDEVVE